MKKSAKGISYSKWGYIFSIPFIVTFLIFSLYPTIYTIALGFTDCEGLAASNPQLLDDPLQNFKSILQNETFLISLRNTVVIWLMNFIPQITIALLLAAVFTSHRSKIRGKGAFKIIFYMPNIITAASVAILFNSMFSYPVGAVNDIMLSLGRSKIYAFIVDFPMYIADSVRYIFKLSDNNGIFGAIIDVLFGSEMPVRHLLKSLARDEAYNFFVDKTAAKCIVAFIQFLIWYGNTMILLISGINGINPDIYEAAEIDGANGLQMFFRITLPNLRTILLYTLITSLVGGLNMYDVPQLFLEGGPDNATLTTSVFIYNQAFSTKHLYNKAAAASMILFVIIAALSAVLFRIMRDKDDEKIDRKRRTAKNVSDS